MIELSITKNKLDDNSKGLLSEYFTAVCPNQEATGDIDWTVIPDKKAVQGKARIDDDRYLAIDVQLNDDSGIDNLSCQIKSSDSDTVLETLDICSLTPLQEMELKVKYAAPSDNKWDHTWKQNNLLSHVIFSENDFDIDDTVDIPENNMDTEQDEPIFVSPGPELHGYVEGIVPVPDFFLTFQQANAYLYDLAHTFETTLYALLSDIPMKDGEKVTLNNCKYPSLYKSNNIIKITSPNENGIDLWFQALSHPDQVEVFESAIRKLFFV